MIRMIVTAVTKKFSRAIFEKLVVRQVVHKLTGCYGPISFISVCITDKTGAYPQPAKFSQRPTSCDDVWRLQCFKLAHKYDILMVMFRLNERNLTLLLSLLPSTCKSIKPDTIITPTKCTLLLLKAPDITICTFCLIFCP
jgi:hypothetical protein